MAEEVPPRDSPRLIEFDDGVHDLVRQDQAHVHPESRPEAEPLWAAGPNVGNRAGTMTGCCVGSARKSKIRCGTAAMTRSTETIDGTP
jgi:hypothetical protein